MEVIRGSLWKRCLSTPIKPPAKSSNICLSETAYRHKGTRKKCKKTNQAAIIQWQRQCLMDKPHCKPWPKSKTSDISKQSPSLLHHTFLLGRAGFTAQPLSALLHVVGFGATAKSHFQACALRHFGGFFTSGRRSRGRRSDLLKLPICLLQCRYPEWEQTLLTYY